jgi:hypothetical protein
MTSPPPTEARLVLSKPDMTSLDQADVQVRGRVVKSPSTQLGGRTVVVSGRWIKIAALMDEELVEGEPVADPQAFVSRLKETSLGADIFTFAQKLPHITPRYTYHVEWDNLAVIPITSFADWWDRRIESSVRRAVRKATKLGVLAKETHFDDAFVDGIVKIYNETPIRQGRAFWHYHKGIDVVRRENSTYIERSAFIGAYYQDEMIGFLRMVYVDKMASIIQILSQIKHSDKRPTNALIAKAVEVCAHKGISQLVYCAYVYHDPSSSLTEFKRRNGFEQVLLPRYYVPLTLLGRMALRLRLHRDLLERVPPPVLAQLRKLRTRWNGRRSVAGTDSE